METKLQETLLNRFGFDRFRPFQLEAIQTLFSEGKLLCIFPTGHGKSLLYQLPAVLLDGITVVISPLLALMRDQIGQLNGRFKIPAASINSDQSDEENQRALQSALSGELKILFVAPEQLDHIDRFAFFTKLPISLLVVDEAHCISTWGHDFRPSYRQIIRLVRAVKQAKILALTATANQKTEQDIRDQLSGDGEPVKVLRQSLDRSNLHLSVLRTYNIEEKLALTARLIDELEGSGLIYCSTREHVEIVADYLKEQGVNAEGYHAGYSPEKKREMQQAFVLDRYKVLAATNALGMGIDKPNIRFIIHFDFPGSITAYYQEVGRAGRDGKPSKGILLYRSRDIRVQHYFIQSSQPQREDFVQILQVLKGRALGLMEIKAQTGLHPTRVTVVIAELVEQGFLEKVSLQGRQRYVLQEADKPLDLSRYQIQLKTKLNELHAMTHYSEQNNRCYMALLRVALGDTSVEDCGRCSICTGSDEQKKAGGLAAVSDWLTKRSVSIAQAKDYSAGVAILESHLRSPLFVRFMKTRQQPSLIDPEIGRLLEQKLKELPRFAAIVAIPSKTWGSGKAYGEHLSRAYGVPVFQHLLAWKTIPEKRQGELFNNDQRRLNVQGKMSLAEQVKVPPGPILLFDDYTGSGATIKEAARVLRKELGVKEEIIPVTIARVKWRLGSPGMV